MLGLGLIWVDDWVIVGVESGYLVWFDVVVESDNYKVGYL